MSVGPINVDLDWMSALRRSERVAVTKLCYARPVQPILRRCSVNGRLLKTLMLAAATTIAMGLVLAAADSNVGTWKLNLSKSKFNPGPAPKSETLKIEAVGTDGIKFTSDGTDDAGKPTHYEFQAKYDGKAVAVKGNPDWDMIAYKRIDANTVEATTMLAGKPSGTGKVTVSADGKTRTVVQTGTNAAGQKMNNVRVYDKQ